MAVYKAVTARDCLVQYVLQSRSAFPHPASIHQPLRVASCAGREKLKYGRMTSVTVQMLIVLTANVAGPPRTPHLHHLSRLHHASMSPKGKERATSDSDSDDLEYFSFAKKTKAKRAARARSEHCLLHSWFS